MCHTERFDFVLNTKQISINWIFVVNFLFVVVVVGPTVASQLIIAHSFGMFSRYTLFSKNIRWICLNLSSRASPHASISVQIHKVSAMFLRFSLADLSFLCLKWSSFSYSYKSKMLLFFSLNSFALQKWSYILFCRVMSSQNFELFHRHRLRWC